MKLFSITDLPEGRDYATFLSEDQQDGFSGAGVRFYERGSTSEEETLADQQVLLVILQGKGTIQVNDIAHPVSDGDLALIDVGDTWHVVADLVDPPVVLTINAKTSTKRGVIPEGRTPSLETQILGPE